MEYKITDYKGANDLFENLLSSEWQEIGDSIKTAKIHIKASDQEGRIGNSIFDPVGTNFEIKNLLTARDWKDNLGIPVDYRFLGTDVDFVKNGILVEVQFSNYPFLLNNMLRSNLFYRDRITFQGNPANSLVIITKAGKFPSSNSTLYYEQAKRQLDSFSKLNTFDVPIRLIGLYPTLDEENHLVYTKYHKPRYSRTVEEQENRKAIITETRSRYLFSEV